MKALAAFTLEIAHAGRSVRHGGFTLMEMMIGMLVFSLVAIGLTSAVLQTRRYSQLALLRNTAYTIAQGYLEQMESLPAASLMLADNSTNATPIPVPTMGVSYLDMTNIQINDPLYVSPISNLTPAANVTLVARSDVPGDAWNVKNVLIDLSGNTNFLDVNLGNNTGNLNGNVTPITMTMWIDVNISQGVTTASSGVSSQTVTVPTIIIQLDFQYQSNGYLAAGKQKGTLRIARTDVDGG